MKEGYPGAQEQLPSYGYGAACYLVCDNILVILACFSPTKNILVTWTVSTQSDDNMFLSHLELPGSVKGTAT